MDFSVLSSGVFIIALTLGIKLSHVAANIWVQQ